MDDFAVHFYISSFNLPSRILAPSIVVIKLINHYFFVNFNFFLHLRALRGGLAQLARACDWQSQGQGFDSPNLHLRPP